MKAAVFYGIEKGLIVEEVAVPDYSASEVLIKISACGICRTDLHYLHGTPTFKKPPLILGHEISGVIEATGDAVKGFEKNDRVLVPPVFSCGTCMFCRTGRNTICTNQIMVGNHRDGGFAEYIAVPANVIFKLPSDIPLQEGCIISDAISTPYHAITNRANIKAGETIAVFGCGGVGLATVYVASKMGANVIAIDIFDKKLEYAKKFGAFETLNASTQPDVPKRIRKLTGGGVDAAFEVIGNPKSIKSAYESVRWGGRVVVIGYTHEDVTINAGRLMFREIELKGSLGCGLQDYPNLLNFISVTKFDVKALVTHTFSLSDIKKGFTLLEKGDESLIRAIAIP